jgi:ribulose-phosphate 3-epimerase
MFVSALKPLAQSRGVLLDVHLMIENPERLIPDFIKAGADILTVHVETCPHLHRTIQMIKQSGVKAGVSLNPATPLSALEEILPEVDLVLVMTVNPGFGGQSYIKSATHKIEHLRHILDQRGLVSVELEVDGGIHIGTIGEAVRAGASVVVVGSAIFNSYTSIRDNVQAIRQAIPAV